jgi:TolB-like protein/Flp pilus assembly protein TadD
MNVASKISLFLAELKRRKVIRVAVVYAVVGFVVWQVAEIAFPALNLPDAALTFVVAITVLGFPIALVLAWAYEVRPEVPPPTEAAPEETAHFLVHTPPEDPRPSVAVLPFSNLSADPENEYFSDGITFDIINHLAKITGLKVISRTSVMGYKATEKRLRQIGEELGVTSIVEGEVQRIGDRVRINAQLLDARTDEHLWAEQYDRELLDVFAIQSDVAVKVATALKATLTPSEEERIEATPTDDFNAYTLYLKGRYFWDKRGEGLKKGLEYFQRALEIDREYALAHTGVADCYSLLSFYGYLAPKEAMPRAKAAAMRALEIDKDLAEAHCSLGFARCFFDWDLEAAERDFRQAMELNPGYAPAYFWYAGLLTSTGRFAEAAGQNERGLSVDPLSVFGNMHYGWNLVGPRQYERARTQLTKALELEPTYPLAHWLLGGAYWYDSRTDEAIASFERAVEHSGNALWFRAYLASALGESGRVDEARAVLSEMETQSRHRYVRAALTAIVCMGLGEWDEALEWLEKAFDERDMWMITFNVDPLFDPVRSNPRFIALMEKVGVGTA